MIRALLHPRSFAIVGASDRSTFSALLYGNLAAAGHRDRTFLVNPHRPEVHSVRTYASCVDLPGAVDLAFVMVPAERVNDALCDAAAAGARGAVVLSSGFAETGPAGLRRQRELVALAEQLGVTVLGPNVLGFVNVVAGVPAMALADPPAEPGPVALISQSGASCGAMKDFAAMSGVGLSYLVTVGNEAMVGVGQLVDHLVDDDAVRAIAVFMEGVREPVRFAAAARRAARAGKALVVLKAGRSALAARTAASHTGALVGDDRVVDAVFRELGVIRVDTVEELLVTAGLAAYTGPLERPGIGVVSISGGACDIAADLAQAAGAALPELDPATVTAVAGRMPAYGHVQNPLDLTGAAVTDPSLWEHAVTAVGNDPSVGAVVAVGSLPWREDGKPFYAQPQLDAIGRGMAASSAPGAFVTQVTQPIGPQAGQALSTAGIPHAVPGLRLALDALARIAAWSSSDPRDLSVVVPDKSRIAGAGSGPRELLAWAGVPVVPAVHVRDARAAANAAAELGCPVAMTIVSADIPHKSDIGGVRLDVAPQDAARAYEQIVAAAGRVGDAVLDGVLVSPMRKPATELLVGVTRDPDWGLVLAVGIGGVLVEVLDDVVLAPLPVDPVRVRRMLARLRGAALLTGVRGRAPADLDRVAEVVAAVGRLAADLGDRLESLEVNPLRVDGSDVEALDVLVAWRDIGPKSCA